MPRKRLVRDASAVSVADRSRGGRDQPSGDWEGMALLPGREFLMGSEDRLAYPDDGEGPVRRVRVSSFHIGDRLVGGDAPPLVIAEIGINHGGRLDVARAMVDAAADAGAEIVKHQTHVVDDEMSLTTGPALATNEGHEARLHGGTASPLSGRSGCVTWPCRHSTLWGPVRLGWQTLGR